MDTPEIFISYTWQGESLKITEALDTFLQARGITVVRDNRDIGYKGLIKEYMQRLGQGKYVVVVLSDQYFTSKDCMFELLQLSRQEGFYDRIFPITVEGISIYEAEDLLRYARYWDEKIAHLQQEIKNTANITNLQGITDDLNLYVEIRQNIAKLIDFLRNINTHPLKGSNFDPLLKAIQSKIAQDQALSAAPEEVSRATEATTPAQSKTVVVMSGEGRRWACLIGANEYDEATLPSLAYPEANVDAFIRVLEDQQLGDFDQVVVLKGKTHTEIIREIKSLTGQLTLADLLLVYFTGYVLLDKEETGKLYLLGASSDPADLPGSAIELGRIKTFLDKSEAVQKMLILDCQYGGQTPPYHLTDPDLVQTQLGCARQGAYLISNAVQGAAGSAEPSASSLTQYLLEGLTTGKADLDQNGKVTVDEWYTYAQRQMVDRSLPEPLKWDPGTAGNWVVARTPGTSAQTAAMLPASLKRNYKYISDMFRDGSVIPFLGSEMVLPADPAAVAEASVNEPPLERELAQKMAEQAELLQTGQCHPLTVMSQYYQMQVVGARPLFYKQLKKLYPQHVRPGAIHRFLAQQDQPMVVITASYDTLLEQVFREHGKPYAVVTHIAYAEDEGNLGKVAVSYSDRPDNAEIGLSDELSIDLEKWWVFYKIQGTFDLFVKGLAGKEELDSIVISEEDYVAWLSRLSDQHRTIPTLFQRVFQQRLFLFLGYRMCDWNFRTLVHILRKDEKIRKVNAYAVRQNATDFERSYWKSKNVQILDFETSEFIQGLAEEMNIQL
ncbi:TIR protein [Candidatus Vecturithrix granuli]|uniref:TIR protein n=1 Tax=Vecturithrix granuli TaxID=1499967 RepID=A0A081BVX7_VECG1|nr:TIR protein [Candidatus Vecturithrix granuli]